MATALEALADRTEEVVHRLGVQETLCAEGSGPGGLSVGRLSVRGRASRRRCGRWQSCRFGRGMSGSPGAGRIGFGDDPFEGGLHANHLVEEIPDSRDFPSVAWWSSSTFATREDLPQRRSSLHDRLTGGNYSLSKWRSSVSLRRARLHFTIGCRSSTSAEGALSSKLTLSTPDVIHT
jgi:hypothetical protein